MDPIILEFETDHIWTKQVDRLAWRLNRLKEGHQVVINLQSDWLTSIDLILLLLTIRIAYEKTHQKVKLSSIKSEINSYLRLISFYELVKDICIPFKFNSRVNTFFSSFKKTNFNQQVVLTEMKTLADIEKFALNLNEVLLRYFPGNNMDIYRGKVSTVVLEACSNGVEHSGGFTYGIIQAYGFSNNHQVHIAIGDNGIGIPSHMAQKYPEIGDSDLMYIRRALEGFSGRYGERGGNGLRRIREICMELSGSFSIRSGKMTVAVLPDEKRRSNKAVFPGTQLNIVLFPEI